MIYIHIIQWVSSFLTQSENKSCNQNHFSSVGLIDRLSEFDLSEFWNSWILPRYKIMVQELFKFKTLGCHAIIHIDDLRHVTVKALA
jgi:hypothetical protein